MPSCIPSFSICHDVVVIGLMQAVKSRTKMFIFQEFYQKFQAGFIFTLENL